MKPGFPQRTFQKSVDAFWGRVIKGECCWEWTGPTANRGYGQIRVNGKNMLVHRLSFLIHHGPIPEGLFVCHHCDNRKCVNPAHIYAGTSKDNVGDMIRRGRNNPARGQRAPNAILAPAKIIDIRTRAAAGVQHKTIAAEYGVHASTITRVANRQAWKWMA